MIHRLFTILSSQSLLLFLAMAVACVRSCCAPMGYCWSDGQKWPFGPDHLYN